MPFPLIIPIVLAGLAALGLSACPTSTGRPEEDDDDITPRSDDDDDIAPVDDDDTDVPVDYDSDEDGYFSCETPTDVLEKLTSGTMICDCDDNDATINPGVADDTDDNVDNNCNGSIDEDYVEPSVCDEVTGLQFNPVPFVIEGEDVFDAGFGLAVTGGDMDGDGINDLVLGFPAAWNETQETMGRVYSVLGGETIVPGGHLLLGDADAIFTGNTDDEGPGDSLAASADYLFVGAPGTDSVYVLNPSDFSTQAILQGSIVGEKLFIIPDIDEVGGPGELVVGGNGQFDIIPLENIGSGTQNIEGIRQYHVASDVGYLFIDTVAAGDMDGDGLAEVAFGDGYDFYDEAGKVYLLQGGSWVSSNVDLLAKSGANIFTLTGTDPDQSAGDSLATGDIDGDGVADLFVGSSGEDNGHENSGGLHKISSQGFTSSLYGTTMNLGSGGTLDLPEGLAVYGNQEDTSLPNSVAFINDAECGLSAVVGSTDEYDRAFVLSAATLASFVGATDATVDEADQEFVGEEGSEFGKGVYAIGDVNGDGIPDLAVTAPVGPDGSMTGQVYVYLGDRI